MELRRWALWIGLIVVCALPLYGALLSVSAPGPFEAVRKAVNSQPSAQPWDVLQADGVLQFYPWRKLVLESWARGEAPFWNPYQLAGTPLMANSQSGAWYPPHVLFGLLRVPVEPAMALLAWLHLAWAGLGLAFLARSLGVSRLGSAVGGLLFGLSPFMVLWAALPSVISTVSWIPWILAFGIGSARGQHGSAGWLAGGIGMMFLAGHLQFAAYGLIGLALVVPFFWSRQSGFKPIGWTVGCVALGIGLAAIHLVPVLDYSRDSHRRTSPTSEGYQAYVAGSLKPYELANLAAPTLLGNPRANDTVLDGAPSYWVPFVKQGGNLAESAASWGTVGWVLATLALFRWSRVTLLPWLALAIVSLLLAMGTPLNAPLYYGVPGWASTGSPARILVLFVLGGCVLAALGFDRLSERRLAGKGIAALLAALLVPVVFQRLSPAAPQGLDGTAWTAWQARSMASSLVWLLPALAVPWFGKRPEWTTALALGSVGLTSLLLKPEHGRFEVPADIAPGEGRKAFVQHGWGLAAPGQITLMPNLAAVAGIRDVAGYDSLTSRDAVEMLREANGQDPAPPANGNMMFVKPTASPDALAELGVDTVYSTQALGVEWSQYSEGTTSLGWNKYRIPGFRIQSDRPTSVIHDLPGRISVRTSEGVLVVRERAARGWKAEIDGATAELLPGRWLSVNVPAGEHRIDFSYEPPGLTAGTLIWTPALLVWMWLIWAQTRPSKSGLERTSVIQ